MAKTSVKPRTQRVPRAPVPSPPSKTISKKRKRPDFGKLNNDTITLEAQDLTKVSVHRCVAVHYIQSCPNDIYSGEEQNLKWKRITLESTGPVVSLMVQWMYTCKFRDEDEDEEYPPFQVLFGLYFLAKKLSIPLLQNECIVCLFEKTKREGCKVLREVKFVYEHSERGSQIRKFLLDVVFDFVQGYQMQDLFTEFPELCPLEFAIDVAAGAMGRWLDGGNPTITELKKYLVPLEDIEESEDSNQSEDTITAQ